MIECDNYAVIYREREREPLVRCRRRWESVKNRQELVVGRNLSEVSRLAFVLA